MAMKMMFGVCFLLLSLSMKAQQSFLPFPKASDTKYWRKQVPMAMRNDYIQLGTSI